MKKTASFLQVEYFIMCVLSFEVSLVALGVLKRKGERLAFPGKKDQIA